MMRYTDLQLTTRVRLISSFNDHSRDSSISCVVTARSRNYGCFFLLQDILVELDHKQASPPRVLNIVFSVPPLILDASCESVSGGRPPTKYRMPNSGALQLKYSAAENTEYLSYENWIAQSLVEIHDISAEDGDVALAKDALSERLLRFWDNLDHLKHEEWCRQRISPGQSPRRNGQIVVFTGMFSVCDFVLR